MSSLAGRSALRADEQTEKVEVRYWLKAAALNSLILIVLGLTTYGPAAFLQYGRADDYWLLLNNATHAPESSARVWVEAGRFIPALASTWVFPYVDTVPELLHMRLVAIVALSFTGVGISLMTLHLVGAPRTTTLRALAIVVGLVALGTPAAPSAATWAVMAAQLWALPLALASGLVATAGRIVLGLRWELASALLMLLAAFTYQPAAAAALLPVFMWSALRWARNEPPHWRRPVLVTALLVASLACNVAIVRHFGWAGSNRLGGHGLGESLMWFIAGYLPRTIAASVPTTIASVAVTLVVLTTAMFSPATVSRRFLALPASVLAAWFLAALIVVPGELWASHRLVMTPQIMLWSGTLACLAVTVRQWQNSDPRAMRSLVGALAAAAMALLAVGGFRAYAYLAKPNAVDWASVQCVVRQSLPVTRDSVLVLNPFNASVSRVRDYDEYGIIASATKWVLPDIVWLAAQNVDKSRLPPRVNPQQLTVVEDGSANVGGPHVLRFTQDICGALQAESASAPSRNTDE